MGRYNAGPQYEEIDEFEDFDEPDDPYGDDSDFEDFTAKRKRKKKDAAPSKSTRRGRNDDCEKPFVCDSKYHAMSDVSRDRQFLRTRNIILTLPPGTAAGILVIVVLLV